MAKPVVFVVGPNGAGKGTVGTTIARVVGFAYWEMGEILRGIARSNIAGSSTTEMINSFQAAGELLVDELIFPLFDSMIGSYTNAPGIVFDGLPRTIPQLGTTLERLVALGYGRFYTFFCNVPIEMLQERLESQSRADRRTDGGAIARRLQVYQDYTLPMIGLLRQSRDFYAIDTTQPKEQTRLEVAELAGRLFAKQC